MEMERGRVMNPVPIWLAVIGFVLIAVATFIKWRIGKGMAKIEISEKATSELYLGPSPFPKKEVIKSSVQ